MEMYQLQNTGEKGILSKIISIGIVLFSVLSSIILFDRLRIYDFVIDGLLIYFLFFKKINSKVNDNTNYK